MTKVDKDSVEFARNTAERAESIIEKIEKINSYLGSVAEQIVDFGTSAADLETLCFSNSSSNGDIEMKRTEVSREYDKLNFCFKFIDKLYDELF